MARIMIVDVQMKKRLSIPLLLSAAATAMCLAPAHARERAKLGPFLSQLAREHDDRGEAAAVDLAALRGMRLRHHGAGTLVPVILEPRPGAGPGSIDVAKVRALGGTVDATSRFLMRVFAPPGALRDLATHPDVRRARAPAPRKAHYGGEESESVDLTGARSFLDSGTGIDGTGVRVAVVDLGFIGLSSAIAAGELPPDTVVVDLPGTGDDDIESYTQHGVGVAEHVVDMAPGVKLYCILVYDDLDLQNAADYIRDNHIRIANHSVGWVTFSYYDDTGPINAVFNDSHDNEGVFWTISSGNDAEAHWRGGWLDEDADDILEFAAGDEGLELATHSNSASIFLNWNQYGNSVTDLDLYVFDRTGKWVTRFQGQGVQNGPQDPAEEVHFSYSTNKAPYFVQVRVYSGPTTGLTPPLDMTIFSFYNDFEVGLQVPESSLMDPADAHGVYTVGAIDQAVWDTAPVAEDYSSRGPTNDGRPKPEIVAPDGTTSWTYGPPLPDHSSGAFGTSFSSPTVAGAAALLLDMDPTLTADGIAAALTSLAISPPGPDNTYGAGKLNLVLPTGSIAIDNVQVVEPADPGDVPQYSKVELLVTLSGLAATDFCNPDPLTGGLDLWADFTGPSGAWKVYGFYDGSNWRIRFAPDTEEGWTFSVTAVDRSGTDSWTGGSFTCTAPDSLGWLRIGWQRLWFTEDWPNNPFFGVGHNTGWQDDVEQPALTDMKASGENLLTFWIGEPWKEPGWGPPSDARAPIENAEQMLGNYNQTACSYIDGVIDRAEAADVYLLPTIWSHGQLRGAGHPWGAGWWYNNAYSDVCSATDFFKTMEGPDPTPQWRYQQNLYRYMIARWGYSRAIAGWVAVCEIDGTNGYEGNSAQAENWCVEVGDYFRLYDNFRVLAEKHPMTASKTDNYSPGAASWDVGFDLRSVDSYLRKSDDIAVAATVGSETETMAASTKPCFHAEFGGDVVNSPPGPATQPAHLHNGIWAGFSAGAAVTPLVWCDGGDFPMLTPGMRNHLQYLSDFAAGLECLGDTALASAVVTAGGGPPDYNAWGMMLPDRGFAWVHKTTPGTLGGETLTISGVAEGDYFVFWYNVWASGQDYIGVSGPITVGAGNPLPATIPAFGQSDVACKFWKSSVVPTCVLMGEMSARSGGVGAVVEWTTESEVDNLGFHVLRRPASGGRWERVTAQPIAGRLTAVGAKTYRYLDLAAPGRYEYRVETISTDGERERHGSRKTMTVEVRDQDAVASLAEASGLLVERAAEACGAWRADLSVKRRRRQLAQRPKREAPATRHRPKRRAHVRRLASVALPAQARAPSHGRSPAQAAGERPSPGDVRVRTRGDGVFFVPAGSLPCPPGKAWLLTGGVRALPLEADASGIWFFAAGYRDAYTDTNATFVTPGRASARGSGRGPAPGGPFAREACSVMVDAARAEEDVLFLFAAEDAPDPWFYNTLLWSGAPEQRVQVQLAGLMPGATALRVAVFGYTYDDTLDPDHELVVSVNDRAVADLFWDGRGYKVFEIPLEEGTAREGINTIGLLAPLTASIPNGHGVVLDYVEIEHPRTLSVAGGALLVEVEDRCVVELAGLSAPALWVVEVGPAGSARRVATAFREAPGGGYVARFRTTAGRYYVAQPDQVRMPEDVRRAVIAEAPAGTSYLAVGPEAFRGSAEPLLDARRGEGLSPAYVSLASAIDTYGHGRYGAAAIVNLVRELEPRYVLLVGDNSYDYLDREGKGVDPMVPAALARARHECQANADALYGDLDGDGTPEVPVGRLPVRTTGELERLLAKILNRHVCSPDLAGVLVADDASKGHDFALAQEAVAEGFPEVAWTKLYSGVHGEGAFIREALTETVNSGADLVVYQGHGSSLRLGSRYPLLDPGEAARWTGAPVVYLSTCWGAYVQKNTESAWSIAEVLLRSRGGATAVIGSTAISTQGAQRALLGDFLSAALRDGARIGDALVHAQRDAARRAASAATEEARQDILDTVHCYTVLGDPATPIILGLREQLFDGSGASKGPELPHGLQRGPRERAIERNRN